MLQERKKCDNELANETERTLEMAAGNNTSQGHFDCRPNASSGEALKTVTRANVFTLGCIFPVIVRKCLSPPSHQAEWEM